ncbi:methyltransferase [Micromonospora sp. ATCC 39149]|uniref:Methyltransferase n=1 Tax=Micromonospora carbonacea TaxID=47853 RepID=A0A7D5YE54_9ACTN|nr:methyltransferase [Micromonospora sp. ATCC 39149]QLJ99353.1 methyltransferase [Micromonospora carbonacea]
MTVPDTDERATTTDEPSARRAQTGADAAWPELMRLVFGGMASRLVGYCVRLGLPDAIGDDERTPQELALRYDARADTMFRVLRALAALRVLTETTPGRFALAPMGALLRGDRPGTLRPLARMLTDPAMTTAWDGLAHSVRTGEPAFDGIFGTDFFSYVGGRPDLSELYNAAMSQVTHSVAAAVAERTDLAGVRTVVDVGGGDGTLLAAVLAANPGVRGVLYDSASGSAEAAGNLRRAGVGDRCRIEVGDFFERVPADADLYLLKSVIHGWGDGRATGILRHCAEAVAPGGRIVMIDHVLPDVVGPAANALAYLTDVGMLVNGQGLERTRGDLERLCGKAGLSLEDVTPLPPTDFHWIESRPA